jgi:predicted signal transduction protein with EAL and GGDEF domain
VIVDVAKRLNRAVRPGDVLARLGGDKFVLVCRDVDHPEVLIAIAERFRTVFRGDVEFDDPVHGPMLWPLAASIGAALGLVESGLASLLAQADRAMNRDKKVRRDELDADIAAADVDAESKIALSPTSQPRTTTLRNGVNPEPEMATVHALPRRASEPTAPEQK